MSEISWGMNLWRLHRFNLTTNPEITRKAIESVAEKTVPESLDFFSEEERDDLLSFLDSLG